MLYSNKRNHKDFLTNFRQIDRQKDRQIDRQIDRQVDIYLFKEYGTVVSQTSICYSLFVKEFCFSIFYNVSILNQPLLFIFRKIFLQVLFVFCSFILLFDNTRLRKESVCKKKCLKWFKTFYHMVVMNVFIILCNLLSL